jgi:hypothetical protein
MVEFGLGERQRHLPLGLAHDTAYQQQIWRILTEARGA